MRALPWWLMLACGVTECVSAAVVVLKPITQNGVISSGKVTRFVDIAGRDFSAQFTGLIGTNIPLGTYDFQVSGAQYLAMGQLLVTEEKTLGIVSISPTWTTGGGKAIAVDSSAVLVTGEIRECRGELVDRWVSVYPLYGHGPVRSTMVDTGGRFAIRLPMGRYLLAVFLNGELFLDKALDLHKQSSGPVIVQLDAGASKCPE